METILTCPSFCPLFFLSTDNMWWHTGQAAGFWWQRNTRLRRSYQRGNRQKMGGKFLWGGKNSVHLQSLIPSFTYSLHMCLIFIQDHLERAIFFLFSCLRDGFIHSFICTWEGKKMKREREDISKLRVDLGTNASRALFPLISPPFSNVGTNFFLWGSLATWLGGDVFISLSLKVWE